jgi:hypothetical protein
MSESCLMSYDRGLSSVSHESCFRTRDGFKVFTVRCMERVGSKSSFLLQVQGSREDFPRTC